MFKFRSEHLWTKVPVKLVGDMMFQFQSTDLMVQIIRPENKQLTKVFISIINNFQNVTVVFAIGVCRRSKNWLRAVKTWRQSNQRRVTIKGYSLYGIKEAICTIINRAGCIGHIVSHGSFVVVEGWKF